MSPFFLLIFLSLVDSIFVGYRAAAGRNPALHKVDYYLKAAWLGLGLGVVAVLLLLGFLAVGLSASQAPTLLLRDFENVCRILVQIYGLFATLVLAALLIWTYPHRKGREVSVMLILGPFTLLRPWWLLLGVVWAALSATSAPVACGVVLAGLAQFAVELLANLIQERAQIECMKIWTRSAAAED